MLSVTTISAAQSTLDAKSDEGNPSILLASGPPFAASRSDQGVVSDSFVADRMLLLLRRSPEKENQLSQFLKDVHSPISPLYHHWLNAKQFGELYGPSDLDISLVTSWLQRAGFQVNSVTQGRVAIEFSGTAAQVRNTFHSEIHVYQNQKVQYHSTNSEPQIPAALSSIVAGLTPINDLPIKSFQTLPKRAVFRSAESAAGPMWTKSGTSYLLTPADFSVQYDIQPAYSGDNGTGVTVGVIGVADVNSSYIAAYQTLFNLPANPIRVVLNGSNPGTLNDDEEALLDVEVLNGVAPGAAINLYVAQGTAAQQALNLAALKAVEDNVAPVLTVSYGFCEQILGRGGNIFWNSVWQQAAAQGQTVLVSTGDFGSAGCDNFEVQPLPQAMSGLAVNGIASTPWNVAVGGTDFSYGDYAGTPSAKSVELATYWNQTSTSLPMPSLMRPVPEQAWNTAFGLNLNNSGIYDPSVNLVYAGAGGVSGCIAGGVNAAALDTCAAAYSKPSWQQGVGVPLDSVRDLPDISLFAAPELSNSSAYPICARPTDCIVANGSVMITEAGGTSASTPAMAGIMALVVQRYGRQGQADYVFYPLAAQHPSVFHDIRTGGNDVPCLQGTPNCTLSTTNDNTAGVFTLGRYLATPGYDLATGLGSVDVNLLLQYWNSLSVKPSANLVGSLSPTFLNVTQSTVVTATVSATAGLPLPTGSVSIGVLRSGTPDYSCNVQPLVSGIASCTLQGTFLGEGQDVIVLNYSGDMNYNASSIVLPVDVTAPISISGSPIFFPAGATTGNASTITLTGLQAFVGSVTLQCFLTASPMGAQNLPGCSLPQSLTVAGANFISTSMTISSQGALLAKSPVIPAHQGSRKTWSGGLSFACICLLIGPAFRRCRHGAITVFLVGAGLSCLAGCGKDQLVDSRAGTTPGVYAFAVSATLQGIVVNTTVSVTIQ